MPCVAGVALFGLACAVTSSRTVPFSLRSEGRVSARILSLERRDDLGAAEARLDGEDLAAVD